MQTKRVRYTYNREGYFYFSRRVPDDLVQHYDCRRIVQSLRTKQPSEARSRAALLASKLDAYWAQMRLMNADMPGKHRLRQAVVGSGPISRVGPPVAHSVSLNEALDIYLKQKGAGKGKTFRMAAERACGYLIDAAGLKHLHEYTRADGLAFRDFLVKRGLVGSSVSRVFNSISAVFNFASSELGLDLRNPFQGIYHDRTAGVSKRLPVPVDVIRKIQRECVNIDDDCRWLVALVSDTGLRLSEAAGLRLSDINLDAPVPHVVVEGNQYRGLKTRGSERKVPLVGASLWAAQQILAYSDEQSSEAAAFPRYTRGGFAQANSASAALNKWLRPYVPKGCTMHSFRHAMRDRLRAVDCPSEMIDQIGGWAHVSVGQGYGSGYLLENLQRYLDAIVLR